MSPDDTPADLVDPTRRLLLRASVAGSVLAVTPLSRVWATSERILTLHNLHTGERVSQPYWMNGNYLPDGLSAINTVLRDHRSGEVYPIDPGLLDMLSALQDGVASQREFEVISGYRSPATNAKLQANSSGVAKRSLHMQGRAIDVRLTGVSTATLRDAALGLQAGGVGYYARDRFVHIDTGRVRTW